MANPFASYAAGNSASDWGDNGGLLSKRESREEVKKSANQTSITSPSLLVAVKFSRESRGTDSLTSQNSRLTAAIEKVLKVKFPALEIISYPTRFECSQVNRDEVALSDGFFALLEALQDDLPELDTLPSKVWIMPVSMLRFGKEQSQLRAVVESLQGASEKLDVEVMPLDSFGVPPEKAIDAHSKYHGELERISNKLGTHDDQGKHIDADPNTQNEQLFVKTNAPLIKRKIEQEKDDELKKMIENGIKRSNNLSNIYKTKQDEFKKKYLDIAKCILRSQKEGGELISFIGEKVSELAELVNKSEGPKSPAMYFRSSPTTRSSKVAFGVPCDQFAHNYAYLKHHRQAKIEHGHEIEIAIYFDDQRSRHDACNPQYIHYLAAVIAGVHDSSFITMPNRLSSKERLVMLHQAACAYCGTKVLFSKAIGKPVLELASMETQMKEERRKAKEKFIEEIEGYRKELPHDASADERFMVTYGMSEAMKFIGSCHLKKLELAGMNSKDNQKRGNDGKNDDDNGDDSSSDDSFSDDSFSDDSFSDDDDVSI